MRKNLTRRERIHRRFDLEKIFKEKKKRVFQGLTLLYRENGYYYNRIAVFMRRGFKNAVKRNKCKRILREVYREMKLNIKQGFDFIFICSPGEYSYSIILKRFIGFMEQIGLLNKNRD